MPLESCKDQKSQTLIEFYTELSNRDGPPWNKIGNAMLKFIQMINEIFKETKIFGLTSHANLNLLSKNEYTSTWHVSIQASVLEGYHISHKDVKLFAKDIIEAKEHLLNAMIKSNGWPKKRRIETTSKVIEQILEINKRKMSLRFIRFKSLHRIASIILVLILKTLL